MNEGQKEVKRLKAIIEHLKRARTNPRIDPEYANRKIDRAKEKLADLERS